MCLIVPIALILLPFQDYENDALNNLKKILVSKWDFVTMQAEEQVRTDSVRLHLGFRSLAFHSIWPQPTTPTADTPYPMLPFLILKCPLCAFAQSKHDSNSIYSIVKGEQ